MMRAHSWPGHCRRCRDSRRSSRASPQRCCAPGNSVCAAQYGPRPTIGLPQRVNGRFSPSGHWQPRGIGGGGGAATAGGGFSGGGRRGGMPHYVAVTPSGCHTGRAEVSDVMQECSTPVARRSVRRHHPVGVAAAALRAAIACRWISGVSPRPLSISFCRSAGA